MELKNTLKTTDLTDPHHFTTSLTQYKFLRKAYDTGVPQGVRELTAYTLQSVLVQCHFKRNLKEKWEKNLPGFKKKNCKYKLV